MGQSFCQSSFQDCAPSLQGLLISRPRTGPSGSRYGHSNLWIPLPISESEGARALRRILSGKKIKVGIYSRGLYVASSCISLWPQFGHFIISSSNCSSISSWVEMEKGRASLNSIRRKSKIPPHFGQRRFPAKPKASSLPPPKRMGFP